MTKKNKNLLIDLFKSFVITILLITMWTVIVLWLCGCQTTRVTNGSGFNHKGSTVLVKRKQIWLAWGLIPLGKNNIILPKESIVIIKNNAFDLSVALITAGFVQTKTVKIKTTPYHEK